MADGHEIQQTFSFSAAGIEALGDVEGVVDQVLLIFQALVLQKCNHSFGGAVLFDGVTTELLVESAPQSVPASVSYTVLIKKKTKKKPNQIKTQRYETLELRGFHENNLLMEYILLSDLKNI